MFSVFAEDILPRNHLRFTWLGEEPEVNLRDTRKNKLSETVECREKKHFNRSLKK